jgi:transposase
MMAFLPPYSPELNPDEQVWNHAKAEAGKRIIRNKQEMEALIFATMQAIQQKIDLVRSFFRLTDTAYAKDFG